jgi:hypothetical protein
MGEMFIDDYYSEDENENYYGGAQSPTEVLNLLKVTYLKNTFEKYPECSICLVDY